MLIGPSCAFSYLLYFCGASVLKFWVRAHFCFLTKVFSRWPDVVVQFEDFESVKAVPLLEKYRDKYRCFNDDIQVLLYKEVNMFSCTMT